MDFLYSEQEMSELSYERTVLFQTEEFEVVSIIWSDKSVSALHDHGWSQCFVKIEEGIFENILDLGIKREVKTFSAGQVISTPIGAKHEIRCKSPRGKTLHVYTPRLKTVMDKPKFGNLDNQLLKEKLSLALPTTIENLRELLNDLRRESISTESPYFMNQLFSGILPQMLIAEEFLAQTKTTLATFEASPVLSLIEAEVIDSLCQLIGWSKEKRNGVSVPGGSAANFMALHCARQFLLPNSKKEGVNGSSLKIFVSEEAHYSFKKACVVLGLGQDGLVTVPVDKNGRMDPIALESLINKYQSQGATPVLVVATAGTTVLGAFDDISALSSICNKYHIWLHIDGAWGGPAIFSKKMSSLLHGADLADSMTFDAHKLFGANLTSSFFLTKHKDILLEANDVSGGDYLFHTEDPNLDRGRLAWQCGRKGDAMSFWTIWKSIGTDGLRDFVDRMAGIREEIIPWIKEQKRLQIIGQPEYLNLCVRVLPPKDENPADWSKIIRERLKTKGLAFVNFSTNQNGSFLRLILAHPFLTFQHIKQILEWALDEK